MQHTTEIYDQTRKKKDMKKTTIWISPEGVPMHSVTGWPTPPGRYFTHYTVNGQTAETGQRAWEIYRDALAKAKKEAIEFEQNQSLTRAIILAKNNIKNGFISSNSFIEIEGEVTNIWQFKLNGKWHDFSSEAIEVVNRYTNEGAETRQVARLKPAEADGPSIKVHGQGFHIDKMKPAESVSVDNDYNPFIQGSPLTAQQINEECQKHNDKLVKQLAASNARIKELEEMYFIAEYALRDIDLFEDTDSLRNDLCLRTQCRTHRETVSNIAIIALNKLADMPHPVKNLE